MKKMEREKPSKTVEIMLGDLLQRLDEMKEITEDIETRLEFVELKAGNNEWDLKVAHDNLVELIDQAKRQVDKLEEDFELRMKKWKN